jgi:hypothetical protein
MKLTYRIPCRLHGTTDGRLELTLDLNAKTFTAKVWDDGGRDATGAVVPLCILEEDGPFYVTPRGLRTPKFPTLFVRLTGDQVEFQSHPDDIAVASGAHVPFLVED